jgi:hypothetical protein
MDPLAVFGAADDALFARLGEPGTVVRAGMAAQDVTLMVNDSLQNVGQFGRVVGGRRVVSARNHEWVFQRADEVTVRGRTAKVEALLDNDGLVNRVVLHG